jgi:8-oxo-dGTP diphosphatase
MPEIKIAVDAVVFTIIDNGLNILLIERKKEPYKGKFALPGGFLENNEELEEAATRELHEETGVKDIFLKQLKTYGSVKRDPRGRVISVAFIALINSDRELVASSDALRANWHPTHSLPELAFDHEVIVKDALAQLKIEIQTTNIACQILPERFTLTKMQKLYENILGKELDKRNFRKKIKELELLKETKETFMEGAHRPALLYEFSNKGYSDIKDKVHVFLK